MGRVRTEAFLTAGDVTLCGVAARRLERARAFAKRYGCSDAFDDYRALSGCRPDIVLVETPHLVQDEIVRWALEDGCHVLIGGSPACSGEAARMFARTARSRRLVAEAGYEARYKSVWHRAREIVRERRIGEVVAVRAVAFFPADPSSWYYDQHQSGGMPLTHMTLSLIHI